MDKRLSGCPTDSASSRLVSAMKFKVVAPPDGEIITVAAQKRFRCAEVLLLPQTFELPHDNIFNGGAISAEVLFQLACGIHDTYFQSNTNATMNAVRRVVSGTAMFQGIVEHIAKEMTPSTPSTMRSRWFSTRENLFLASNASITRKCCSSQGVKPAESTIFLSWAT